MSSSTNDKIFRRAMWCRAGIVAGTVAVVCLLAVAFAYNPWQQTSRPWRIEDGLFPVPDDSDVDALIRGLYTNDRSTRVFILIELRFQSPDFTSAQAEAFVRWIGSDYYEPERHEKGVGSMAIFGKAVMVPALLDALERSLQFGDSEATGRHLRLLNGMRDYRRILGSTPSQDNIKHAREFYESTYE